jgi:hypothetical protein
VVLKKRANGFPHCKSLTTLQVAWKQMSNDELLHEVFTIEQVVLRCLTLFPFFFERFTTMQVVLERPVVACHRPLKFSTGQVVLKIRGADHGVVRQFATDHVVFKRTTSRKRLLVHHRTGGF